LIFGEEAMAKLKLRSLGKEVENEKIEEGETSGSVLMNPILNKKFLKEKPEEKPKLETFSE